MLILEASTLVNPKFKSLYRQLTLRFHPDNKKTGDTRLMADLNDAASKGDFSFKVFLDKLADKGILQKTSTSSIEDKKEDIKEKIDRLAKEAKEKDKTVKEQLNVILIKKYIQRYIPALEKTEGVTIDIYFLDSELKKIKFTVLRKPNLFRTLSFTDTIENIVEKTVNEDDIIDYSKIRALFADKVRELKKRERE